jgi:protein-S-isoprenylcysteine O-methyltransferase Ste14
MEVFLLGAPLWFLVFWHWFDFWRTRRTLTYSVWAALFIAVAAVVALTLDALFGPRFAPPPWSAVTGWALMAATTVFGAVADRQLGTRVRSFMPFFDEGHRHIRLRTSGAYAVVRHPIYAAGVWFALGMFLVTGYWVLLASLVVFTLSALWFTRQEERRLTALLEDPTEYDRYRARVGALFPKLAR